MRWCVPGLSPDGEEGYPGNLWVQVTFTLREANALSIQYEARAEGDTLVNLTNHSYFNLDGGGSVLDHELRFLPAALRKTMPDACPQGGCWRWRRLPLISGFPSRSEQKSTRTMPSCAAAAGMTTTMCSPGAGRLFCAADAAALR